MCLGLGYVVKFNHVGMVHLLENFYLIFKHLEMGLLEITEFYCFYRILKVVFHTNSLVYLAAVSWSNLLSDIKFVIPDDFLPFLKEEMFFFCPDLFVHWFHFSHLSVFFRFQIVLIEVDIGILTDEILRMICRKKTVFHWDYRHVQ